MTTPSAEQLPWAAKPVTIGRFAITRVATGDPWRENCFLVQDDATGETVVFDPGAAPELIVAQLRESGARVKYVVLTHAHHDHVGAVHEICTEFDVQCRVHLNDLKLLRQAPLYALRFAKRKILAATAVEPFGNEAVEFPLGPARFEALATPGHTSGSVCYLFPGFAITGDTLLHEHVGRTDLPGSSRDRLLVSVDELLARLGDTDTLFAGHGRTWTAEAARAWWTDARSAPPGLEQHATF